MQALRVGQPPELPAALAHPRGGIGEAFAAPGSDLGLRGDQLADEVVLELRAAGRRLEVLEAVRQGERVRIEERELLFDGDGEVVPGVERLAGLLDQLVVGKPLLVAHRRRRLAGRAGGETAGPPFP